MPEQLRAARERITLFDTLRGFTIISMVAFHACYDLAYIEGVPLPWFTGTPFQAFWRCSISWTFLFIAGWMASFSRNNFKRGGIYAAAAALVFIATTLASVDTPVTFGILFCMAACTLLVAVAKPVLQNVPAPMGLACSLILFALTYTVPLGRYDIAGLAWLGFPGPAFASGDYYPLLPYLFMYLAGFFTSVIVDGITKGGYPAWTKRDWCPSLTAVGHASLIIYLLHQPLLLVLIELL